ncbi:MAG: HSP90 family protein, partial [Planctomycetota bacterium]
LGASLRQYLVGLAEFDRARLDQIIHLHFMPIKALAAEDSEFLRLFVDWLPFETSLGRMTLGEYCKSNSHIRYVPTTEQFHQISGVASAQRLCVFNGGYAYDVEILEQVAQEFPSRQVERIDPNDLVQTFSELSLDESEQVFNLVKVADIVLQKYKCSAEARKFAPADLPMLYTANDSASFLRSVEQSREETDGMWGEILDNVSFQARTDSYAQLVLNFRSPLIQRLTTVNDQDLLGRIVEVLYLQSLLLGNYPLAANERSLLAGGLLGLIDVFLQQTGDQ